MPNSKIAILGAGLCGLSTAYHLKINYEIFEKEDTAGGLCRSYKSSGFTFDYDGHLLHFRNKDIYKLVSNLLGSALKPHQRKSFIRYLGRDIPYPFQASFLNLPERIAKECLAGLKNAKNGHCKDYPNFEEWVYSAFGEGIARHFMVPYNEKFWRMPCKELTCDWFDGFIPVIKFKDVIEQAKKLDNIGYNACFYYPDKGGIEALPSALCSNLREKINFNSKITGISLNKKELTINNTQKIKFKKIISTIPLPELTKIIKNIPKEIAHAAGLLNYNSILVFNIGLKRKINSNKHWIYFPESKYKYFRIGYYNSFSSGMSPAGCDSIYAEYSYPKSGCRNKEQVKKDVLKNLLDSGVVLAREDVVVCDIVNIKYGYPIYDHNYSYATSIITDFLLKNDIHSIGRYGSWRYMTMEDAILDGKRIAVAIDGYGL